jgi:hypothetical protein
MPPNPATQPAAARTNGDTPASAKLPSVGGHGSQPEREARVKGEGIGRPRGRSSFSRDLKPPLADTRLLLADKGVMVFGRF